MTKLLVNTPANGQQLLEVSAGGGYFDKRLVLWDERDDGPLPVITLGGMTRVGGGLILDEALLDSHNIKLAAEATQAAIDTASQEFVAETAAMTASYSQAEIDTFSTQEAEAIAWSFDDTAPTPLLDAIISESGVTKAELVMSVVVKAATLKVAVGAAIGRKKMKQRVA